MNLTPFNLSGDRPAPALKRLGSGPRVRPLAISAQASVEEIVAVISQGIKEVMAQGPPPPAPK